MNGKRDRATRVFTRCDCEQTQKLSALFLSRLLFRVPNACFAGPTKAIRTRVVKSSLSEPNEMKSIHSRCLPSSRFGFGGINDSRLRVHKSNRSPLLYTFYAGGFARDSSGSRSRDLYSQAERTSSRARAHAPSRRRRVRRLPEYIVPNEMRVRCDRGINLRSSPFGDPGDLRPR